MLGPANLRDDGSVGVVDAVMATGVTGGLP